MKHFEEKGYVGSIEFSIEDSVLHGKLLGLKDLVTYEAETIVELKKEFILAVDDYLETCKEVGKEPEKPFKGVFNVRTGRELHRRAVTVAKDRGIKLNELIKIALKKK